MYSVSRDVASRPDTRRLRIADQRASHGQPYFRRCSDQSNSQIKEGKSLALTGSISSQDRRVQCYLQYRYTVCTYIHVPYRFMQVGYLWVILRQSSRSLTRASMTDSLYRGLRKDFMILYSVQNKTVRLYLQLPRLYPWCITLAVSRFSQVQFV